MKKNNSTFFLSVSFSSGTNRLLIPITKISKGSILPYLVLKLKVMVQIVGIHSQIGGIILNFWGEFDNLLQKPKKKLTIFSFLQITKILNRQHFPV